MNNIQLQNLHACITLTQGSGIVHYAKNGLLLFAKWLMYIMAAISLFIALWLPTDPIQFEKVFGEDISVKATLHVEAISVAMIFFKLSVIIMAIAFYAIGFLFGQIKMKNSIIKKVHELLHTIKQNDI